MRSSKRRRGLQLPYQLATNGKIRTGDPIAPVKQIIVASPSADSAAQAAPEDGSSVRLAPTVQLAGGRNESSPVDADELAPTLVVLSDLRTSKNQETAAYEPEETVSDLTAPSLLSEAATAPPTRLSVEACVGMALASHPKIAAARSRVLAAQNRVPQAKALPDPMLDNMFWPIS